MARYLMCSLWRSNADRVERLDIYSEEDGAHDYRLGASLSGTSAPLKAREIGWERVAYYSRTDEIPQFVLDTVDWDDCVVDLSGASPQAPTNVSISVRGRMWLATYRDDLFFKLSTTHAPKGGERSTFGALGELIFSKFELVAPKGDLKLPFNGPKTDRTFSQVMAQEAFKQSAARSNHPVICHALGMDERVMATSMPGATDKSIQYVLDEYKKLPGRPWKYNLDEGRYATWKTEDFKCLWFGLRTIAGTPARYFIEAKIPIAVRRRVRLRDLDVELGPPDEYVDNEFFTVYRLVQRQPTDLVTTSYKGRRPARWIFEIEGLPVERVWQLWNEVVVPERLRALREAEGMTAVSPLPTVLLENAAAGHLFDAPPPTNHGLPDYPMASQDHGWWLVAELFDNSGSLSSKPLREVLLSPRYMRARVKGLAPRVGRGTVIAAGKPYADLQFPLLRKHDGGEFRLQAMRLTHLGGVGDNSGGPYGTDEGDLTPALRDAAPVLNITCALPAYEPTETDPVAVGAYDLVFPVHPQYPPNPETGTSTTEVTVVAVLEPDDDKESWAYLPPAPQTLSFVALPKQRLRLEFNATLPLFDLRPGSQDTPNDRLFEDQSATILIPQRAAGQDRENLLLSVEEISPHQDDSKKSSDNRLIELPRYLRMTVRAPDDQGQHHIGVISIETKPFLVTKMEMTAAVGAAPPSGGSAETNVLAEAIQQAGESLTWQLRKLGQLTMTLPPQGMGETMEKRTGADDDLAEGKTADFRFSPNAVVELDAEERRQALGEVPWNMRRLLNRDETVPGVAINKLSAELVYGLRIDIKPSDAGGASLPTTGLRLTDIEARIGDLPDFAIEEKGTEPAPIVRWRKAWHDLDARWTSRLDVLEVFDPMQPGGLHRSEGVEATLRDTAQLRYPVRIADTERVEQNAPFPPAPGALAGGVGWPFESSNIYEAVWRAPGKGPAEISGLHLSSLGAWGVQKASFDENRTSIYNRVGMGRTHYVCLERKGRIGVFWHRAKHVIIYERTVLPSRQFYNDVDKLQDQHLGRPILRKVKEYVELVTPVRHYPENGQAPAVRGFVLGGEFRTIQIPVDSTWGHDVGAVGWMVPLWNPGKDPAVYPKPLVLLRMATADGDGEHSDQAGSQLVELDEPQKLVFFTSTVKGQGDDTDSWPAVESIDFPDIPQMSAPEKVAPMDTRRPDRRLPDATAVEPGYDAFTYGLARGGRSVSVTADRGGDGVTAVIRNVTMSRARPARDGSSTGNIVMGALKDAQNEAQRLAAIVETGLTKGRGIAADGLAQGKSAQDIAKSIVDEITRDLGKISAVSGIAGQVATLDVCEILKRKQHEVLDQTVARLDQAMNDVGDRLVALESELRLLPQTAWAKLGAAEIERLKDVLGIPGNGADILGRVTANALPRLDAVETEILAAISNLAAQVPDLTPDLADGFARALEALHRQSGAIASDGAAVIATLCDSIAPSVSDEARNAAETLIAVLAEHVRHAIDDGVAAVKAALTTIALQRARDALEEQLNELADAAQMIVREAAQVIRELLWQIEGELAEVEQVVNDKAKEFIDKIKTALNNLLNVPTLDPQFSRKVKEELNAASIALKGDIRREVEETVDDAVSDLCAALGGGTILDRLSQLGTFLQSLEADLAAKLAGLSVPDLDGLFDGLERDVLETANRIANSAMKDLATLAKDVLAGLPDAGQTLNQIGDETLRLLRAFGDPPKLPGLDFNRERLAYYFDDLLPKVDITPVTALLNRVGDDLKGLGLRLPTVSLSDQLLPKSMPDMDLSKILPDFAGLRLENLLPNLKLVDLPPDKVKVRHGVDQQSRRGWVEADISVDSPGATNLFSFEPIRVELVDAKFRAHTRQDIGLDGRVDSRADGRLVGDWRLLVGGFNVMTFVQTPLEFDSEGGVRFKVSPENISMDQAIKFLADAIGTYQGADENTGLNIEVLRLHGLPIGARSRFGLPIPDVAAGTFAITNLYFGASFEIAALPDFALTVRANLGRKTAPFNLTVFILGGGGWVEASATYLPLRGDITTSLTIGISVSAGLALALGPIRGSIMMYVSVYAELYCESRGEHSVDAGISLLIVGQASLCGLVTVSIQLLLDARYVSGGGLIGTGTLSYSIKIGWFFTLNVSVGVRYEFVKGSGTGHRATRRQRLSNDYS